MGYMVNRSGMKQYARGHYALARHRFAKAVASDPGNPDYRHNLAMALQKQGDVAGSEKILRHNLTMNAMHQPTYHSLAQLMISQGRAPEAQELLTAWVSTQPYVPEANIEMAWLQRESGDIAGAEQSLQQALKANPTNAIALSHMGQLYQTAGRQDEAVAYYQRSLAAHWDQPEVQSRLATMTGTRLCHSFGHDADIGCSDDGECPRDDPRTDAGQYTHANRRQHDLGHTGQHERNDDC